MNYYNYYPFYYYKEGGPMVGQMPPAPPPMGSAAPMPPMPGVMPPGSPPPTNPELTKKPETPPQNKAQQDILNRSKELDQKINIQTQPQSPQTQGQPQTNPNVPPVPPPTPPQPVAPVPMPNQTPPPPSPPANPAPAPAMSESLLNYIPSKRQMRRMTREELLVLRKFLKSHVLKEAMENRGIENIKKFAKDSVSKVTNIPDLINTFYPEFINESIDTTYNVILKNSDVKDSALPTLSNLKSTVKSSLDQTMNMINQSSDWISIVLSKNLSDMGMTGKLGNINVGKFLSISALAASVVYIMTKLFKSGFNNANTYSECVKLFKDLYNRKLSSFKEGIDDKLNEYINKEVPSNVITLNSLITKAYPLAQGMLFNIGYDEENLNSVPNNILILTEVCCSLVILYSEVLGKKFKALAKKGKMKAFVSQNLLMKMGNIDTPKDIFSKLSNFKKANLDNAGDNNEGI